MYEALDNLKKNKTNIILEPIKKIAYDLYLGHVLVAREENQHIHLMWFQRASERVNNISSCTENSLRSCARCANARVLAADFRVDRKSTLVVTPPCEWVCIGVNGVLLEVACEFGVGSNSLGYGCRGGCLWLQQVSKGFLFSCWWHRCLRQGLC